MKENLNLNENLGNELTGVPVKRMKEALNESEKENTAPIKNATKL